MKTKKLKVPVEAIDKVAEFINENTLTVLVLGSVKSDVELVVLSLQYGSNEKAEVRELEDLIDDK